MLKKARFAKPLAKIEEMDKPTSAKSKGSSAGSRNRNLSPKSRSSSGKKKSSPSPSRKSGDDLKSALRKGSGDKKRKKTIVKSPDLTEDGLKIVDMSGQGMTIVPLHIINSKDIGHLCMASNNLRSLPVELKKMTTLTKLDISRNGIKCTSPNDFSGMPAEIKQLVNLQELKISECNLPYIPPAIWGMKHLKVLDISRNKINTLLPDIGELESLQKLNLQQTNITTLPPEIAYCQDLEEILLWGNVIESLPETLPEMLKLRTLAVNYRSFCAGVDSFAESEDLLRKGKLTSEHIPAVVFELSTVEVLDLEDTKINNIPDLSTNFLKEFYLGKNFLSKVPPGIFNLHHLTVLDMSQNLLTVLPEDIGRVRSLIILRLNNNAIERIPVNIGHLHNLEELNFAHNQIRYIPSAIRGLRQLKALYVEKNNLSSLPDELCELENLETLDITENRIQALPMKLHLLKNLAVAHSYQKLSKHGLWVYKNPLTQPPPEIWKTERPEKIFEYLKKLAIIKTENLQRQKLLLFGETQSGKTSLVNAFIHRKQMMTKGPEDKTRALEHTIWKTENNVEFIIHDFGGDEAYKMIYPLFVDSKALAVIVYDHSTYSEESHYEAIGQWLDYFNVFMPGVVVKLVGTHIDLFEEYAYESEEEEEDENGNFRLNLRSSSSAGGRSSTGGIRSAQSLRSQSSISSYSHLRKQSTPNDKAGKTSTPRSSTTRLSSAKSGTMTRQSSTSYVGQAKLTEDLVKAAVQKQQQDYMKELENKLKVTENSIKALMSADSESAAKNIQHKHLQTQKKRLEFLINNPLRVIPEVSLVTSNEGLYGVSDLIEKLELMAIDKKLFPHAQRSIPDKWNKFRAHLKQKKAYHLLWGEVEAIAKKFGVGNDQLPDSLQYFKDIGEILWFQDTPGLSKIIFHKPRVLLDVLSSIFRHDMDSFLEYETNKVFMSKGNFSETDFQNAKELFLRNGQISRPMLKCFWFYEHLSYDDFNNLLDLVPVLDLCYSIPEPEIPTGQLYSLPLMVLPWYNIDKADMELRNLWDRITDNYGSSKVVTVAFELPMGMPDGLFEKLLSTLQTHVLTRIDWRDAVYATTEQEVFKIHKVCHCEIELGSRKVSVTLTIVSTTNNESGVLTLLKELSREISDIFLRTPGLVWNVVALDSVWKSQAILCNPKTVTFDD